MRNKWIYDKVNALVKKHQTRDPKQLIGSLNITLKYIRDTTTLLGAYKVILRNRVIFLASNVGFLEKTVLAHEIGHDQLHRKESAQGKTFHESRVFNPINQYEMEANIFAAHLLIPDEDILEMIQYAENDRDLANSLQVDINILNLKISEMAKMNLLEINPYHIQRPHSDFLKKYRPMD